MTSEEAKKDVRDKLVSARDDFQDLLRHPGWMAVQRDIESKMRRLTENLKRPFTLNRQGESYVREPTTLDEVRFTQGQVDALEGLLGFVKSNAEATDEAVEKAVEDRVLKMRSMEEMDNVE
jgi:hypothetical protein